MKSNSDNRLLIVKSIQKGEIRCYRVEDTTLSKGAREQLFVGQVHRAIHDKRMHESDRSKTDLEVRIVAIMNEAVYMDFIEWVHRIDRFFIEMIGGGSGLPILGTMLFVIAHCVELVLADEKGRREPFRTTSPD